jgi:hypothetical protein
MNLIDNNPFRILDLPVTASEREISKQLNTLATYAEMGKTKIFGSDFPFLAKPSRTLDSIEEAKKQIEQGENKFFHSLFWFWKNNSVDELALDVLKEGNIEKAIQLWEKAVHSNKNKALKPVVLNENLIRLSKDWTEIDNENHLLQKRNGDEYLIDRKLDDNYSIPTVSYEFSLDSNWIIECDTTWISGVDNALYGIVFGRKDSSFYSFGIAGSDSFKYCKHVDWGYIPIIDWKPTPKFNKRGSNNLRIENIENTLHFYVNGLKVDSYQAEPFFGNNFGFRVCNKQKVSFRNFKFCKLIDDDSYGVGLNVSIKNFSNIKNLSTLYLSLALTSKNGEVDQNYLRKGVSLAKNLFIDGNMSEYAKLLAGDNYIYNSEKSLHFFINELVESLNPNLVKQNGISIKDIYNIFQTYPTEAKQLLNNKFVAKHISNINKEIEISEESRKKSGNISTTVGKKLIEQTRNDLASIKNTIGEEDYQYVIISDKLSYEIVQCGIAAFNSFKTPSGEIDYVRAIQSEESYLTAYEYALNIAITQRVKERALENVSSCRDYIKDKNLYLCWFCGRNQPEESSKYTITIYKENNRTYFPRRVQFSYVPVSIPRCKSCQEVHSESSNAFLISLIIGAVAGLIVGIIADGYWFGGLLAGGVLGWIVGMVIKSSKTDSASMKSTSTSDIGTYPPIKQRIKEGWQFSEPTA